MINISKTMRHTLKVALWAARWGQNSTTPNPTVGAVLCHNDDIVAIGAHLQAGTPHAEIHAIEHAQQLGASMRECTLFVTLEPCHHHGRTPPCTSAIVHAGIKKVVYLNDDPNPQAQGGGAFLRQKGVEVVSEQELIPHCADIIDEAKMLNAGFFSRMQRHLPYVRLKMAMSLDGRTALADGQSRWISGSASRADGHSFRARSCAILTGIGTVMADDPRLTVREAPSLNTDDEDINPAALESMCAPSLRDFMHGPRHVRQPMKIVLDSLGVMNAGAELLKEGRTLCVGLDSAPPFPSTPHRDYWCAPEKNGRINLLALLHELANRGINDLFIECGPRLAGAFLQESLIDELILYVAPKLLGQDGRPLLMLSPPIALTHDWGLHLVDTKLFDQDLRLIYRRTAPLN